MTNKIFDLWARCLTDYGHFLPALQFMRLQGKRNRGKEEVKFLEIKGDDQLSGNQQWMTKSMTEEKQTRQSFSKVTRQLHYGLFYQTSRIGCKVVHSVYIQDFAQLLEGGVTFRVLCLLLRWKRPPFIHLFDVNSKSFKPNPTEMACAIVSEETANLQSLTV